MMKSAKWLKYGVLVFFIAMSFADNAALARHHRSSGHSRSRSHFSLALGVPIFSSSYRSRPYRSYGYGYGGYGYRSSYYSAYPNPYYSPYAPVVVAQAPPVYIEQAVVEPLAVAAPQASSANVHWYYCAASKGYYPYVDKCPTGWQKVPAQPAGVQ